MNRIDKTFKRLKAEGRKAFIPYITAGDPDIATTKKIIRTLSSSGADIIELGIPFSDPLADGKTIQRAIYRSLCGGSTVKKIFDMAKELRKEIEIPFVFMTYYNIVFNYGVEKFVKDAKQCGVDGIIVPDLPLEESEELAAAAGKYDFCVIMLTAPTTSPERFKRISARSKGFIYYVSLTGVTGARKKLSSELKKEIKKLKKLTNKPLCVGFGISGPSQAKDIAKEADGVIVGSAIIGLIEKNLSSKKEMLNSVGKFAAAISGAVHRA